MMPHGTIPTVRERDVFAFAERQSGFTAKDRFQEELKRGTVLCILSNVVFPSQPIKLADRSTNSPSQRANAHWTSLHKKLKRLGIPLELCDRQRIEQGDHIGVLSAVVMFYFLYNLKQSVDFSAEFGFDVPPAVIDFLQSFTSVRALVLGGALPLRKVPEEHRAQLQAELEEMKNNRQHGGMSSANSTGSGTRSRQPFSRASSRSSSAPLMNGPNQEEGRAPSAGRLPHTGTAGTEFHRAALSDTLTASSPQPSAGSTPPEFQEGGNYVIAPDGTVQYADSQKHDKYRNHPAGPNLETVGNSPSVSPPHQQPPRAPSYSYERAGSVASSAGEFASPAPNDHPLLHAEESAKRRGGKHNTMMASAERHADGGSDSYSGVVSPSVATTHLATAAVVAANYERVRHATPVGGGPTTEEVENSLLRFEEAEAQAEARAAPRHNHRPHQEDQRADEHPAHDDLRRTTTEARRDLQYSSSEGEEDNELDYATAVSSSSSSGGSPSARRSNHHHYQPSDERMTMGQDSSTASTQMSVTDLQEENDELRDRLLQLMERYKQSESEVQQLKGLDKANENLIKKLQEDKETIANALKEQLRLSEERCIVAEDRLAEREEECQELIAVNKMLTIENEDLQRELARGAVVTTTATAGPTTVLATSRSASPPRGVPTGGVGSPGDSVASPTTAAQQMLYSEQQATIDDLRGQVRQLSVDRTRLIEQLSAGTGTQKGSYNPVRVAVEQTLNLSAETASPPATFSMQSPTPLRPRHAPAAVSPQTGSPQTLGRGGAVANSSQRTEAAGPKYVLPSTEIFMRAPSASISMHRQSPSLSPSSGASTAGSGSRGRSVSTVLAGGFSPALRRFVEGGVIRAEDIPDDEVDIDVRGFASPPPGSAAGMADSHHSPSSATTVVQLNCHDLAAEMHHAILQLSVEPSISPNVRLQGALEFLRSKLWLLLSAVHVLEGRIVGAAETIQAIEQEKINTLEEHGELRQKIDLLQNTVEELEHEAQRERNKASLDRESLEDRIDDLEQEAQRQKDEYAVASKKHEQALELVHQEDEKRVQVERKKRRDLQQRCAFLIERDQFWRELCTVLTRLNDVTLRIGTCESEQEAVPLVQQRHDLERRASAITQQLSTSIANEKKTSSSSGGGSNRDSVGTECAEDEQFNSDVSAALRQMVRDAVAEKERLAATLEETARELKGLRSEHAQCGHRQEAARLEQLSLKGRIEQQCEKHAYLLETKNSMELRFNKEIDSIKSELREAQAQVKEAKDVWSVQPEAASAFSPSPMGVHHQSSPESLAKQKADKRIPAEKTLGRKILQQLSGQQAEEENALAPSTGSPLPLVVPSQLGTGDSGIAVGKRSRSWSTPLVERSGSSSGPTSAAQASSSPTPSRSTAIPQSRRLLFPSPSSTLKEVLMPVPSSSAPASWWTS